LKKINLAHSPDADDIFITGLHGSIVVNALENGDVCIKGRNIHMEAKEDITIKAGNNIKIQAKNILELGPGKKGYCKFTETIKRPNWHAILCSHSTSIFWACFYYFSQLFFCFFIQSYIFHTFLQAIFMPFILVWHLVTLAKKSVKNINRCLLPDFWQISKDLVNFF
jgi:hypothetical protein